MCGLACGVSTAIVGAVLVAASCIVSFGFVPRIVDRMIVNEVVLINDTIQMERFKEIPFPLNFTVRIWTISNGDEVLTGAVPEVTEVGPYIYKMYQTRVIHNMDDEEDQLSYRIVDHFEFDAESSYPNTEEDLVTIINVPYHAILQVAEQMFPLLMPLLSTGLNGVFGEFNRPIVEVRVKDLLFEGIGICKNPGLIGGVVCSQVRELSTDVNNLVAQEDGSLIFSLLSYKDAIPSGEYVVYRGIDNHEDLARITSYDGLPHLKYWSDIDGKPGICNDINGTDSGIFAPFVDRKSSIFAINTDICRSVELRYQSDLEFKDIPATRFASNEWFLNNDEGCFCLNMTRGINREDGCLLRGALELYTCVGAFLVLTYPHFLYADFRYKNGVLGMNPIEDEHRIFLDLEPVSAFLVLTYPHFLYADFRYKNGVLGMNPIEDEHRIFLDLEPTTGTVLRGAKRAQFNIFMRPITGIAATQSLRTTLTPIAWFDEGMSLPDEFADELKSRLLVPLNMLSILIPVIIAVCCFLFIVGIVIAVRARTGKPAVSTVITTPITTTKASDGC